MRVHYRSMDSKSYSACVSIETVTKVASAFTYTFTSMGRILAKEVEHTHVFSVWDAGALV